jgi:hypothetical protein
MMVTEIVSGTLDANSTLTQPITQADYFVPYYINIGARTAIGIATGYGLYDGAVRVRVPVGSRIFSMSSRQVLRPTQPAPIQWVLGAPSSGVKRQGHEADHSPPASAKVKKIWIYTSIPPYAFIA